jgi:hypothetical protein
MSGLSRNPRITGVPDAFKRTRDHCGARRTSRRTGRTNTLKKTSRALVIGIAAAIFVACAERAPLEPEADTALPAQLAAVGGTTAIGSAAKTPDLGACQNVQVPARRREGKRPLRLASPRGR